MGCVPRPHLEDPTVSIWERQIGCCSILYSLAWCTSLVLNYSHLNRNFKDLQCMDAYPSLSMDIMEINILIAWSFNCLKNWSNMYVCCQIWSSSRLRLEFSKINTGDKSFCSLCAASGVSLSTQQRYLVIPQILFCSHEWVSEGDQVIHSFLLSKHGIFATQRP